MANEVLKALEKLATASRPFLSGDVVDETSGTIPLMRELEQAIEEAECLLLRSGIAEHSSLGCGLVRVWNRALSAAEVCQFYSREV